MRNLKWINIAISNRICTFFYRHTNIYASIYTTLVEQLILKFQNI